MKKKFITIYILFFSLIVFAQVTDHLLAGNELFRNGQFELAEKHYRAVKPGHADYSKAQFNLATALYNQNKYRDAVTIFQQLENSGADPSIRSAASYDKGVVFTKQKDLEQAIEAYKSALRLVPDDQQARENLQKALMELKKQQQEQNQQKQNRGGGGMSEREAENKLKQLQEKEKDIQQKLNKSDDKGGAMPKDW
jgi:Ca-activated chloride channel homolog